MQLTVDQAITRYGVELDEHLAREISVPIVGAPARQGDVMVADGSGYELNPTTAVPHQGVAVVAGENGGNTHLLLAEGQVFFDTFEGSDENRKFGDVGVMVVSEGATALLAHPEHGYVGFKPGRYVVRRQHELADELRLVAD